MNNADHSYVLTIVSPRLARKKNKCGGVLPEGEIERCLDWELSQEDYDVDREKLLSTLESSFSTLIGNAASLCNTDDLPTTPWVAEWIDQGRLKWDFWLRYRTHLIKEGWPEPVVSKLDQTTTEILDTMMPPNSPGTWDQRGLVVGHVQSGKTANYTGLICKAVGAGYKVVIVLAGAHNSLRTQTQIRLEEGFLGYQTINEDIEERVPTGAGLLSPKMPYMLDTLTTRSQYGDFRTTVAKHSSINPGGNPLLFVVKKNTSVLKNLHNWVVSVAKSHEHSQDTIRNIPLLMIDDESDYASVDTKKQGYDEGDPDPEHDPTKINGWIRKILKSFEQSVYIGYTATPFANIFIPENAEADAYDNDLFPRSFIFSLPAPSNYVGPSKIFGLNDEDQELPIFRMVDDHAESTGLIERGGWVPPRHDKSHTPRYQGEKELPPTLKNAIRSFVIATAARKARGYTTAHNSMLIHVTRFVDVQAKVKEQVEKFFLTLHDRLCYGDGERKPSIFDEFQEIWETDFKPTSEEISEADCTPVDWEDVVPFLKLTVQSIRVREINGSSADVLEYARHTDKNQPFDVIAIGGDKLSRGLTLEGLTVSYFLRHSKMYDTLMQMGRWFGYRPGYLDLCRIYTTSDLQSWFRHISIASEELRRDFSRMAVSRCTPRQFGHRVLCHPQLMVTSPTKMRHAETRDTSFDGCPAETTQFVTKSDVVSGNFAAYQALFSKVQKEQDNDKKPCRQRQDTKKMVWEKVSAEPILEFLTDYQGHSAARAHPQYLHDYIAKQLPRNKLTEWTVYFVQGSGKDVNITQNDSIKQVKRRWHQPPDPPNSGAPFRVRRIGSPSDEYEDLDADERKTALENTISIWEAESAGGDAPTVPRGPAVRFVRPPERGLICLYALEPKECKPYIHPLVGFLLSFPGDEGAKPIRYCVNDVYRRLELEGIRDEYNPD